MKMAFKTAWGFMSQTPQGRKTFGTWCIIYVAWTMEMTDARGRRVEIPEVTASSSNHPVGVGLPPPDTGLDKPLFAESLRANLATVRSSDSSGEEDVENADSMVTRQTRGREQLQLEDASTMSDND